MKLVALAEVLRASKELLSMELTDEERVEMVTLLCQSLPASSKGSAYWRCRQRVIEEIERIGYDEKKTRAPSGRRRRKRQTEKKGTS